MTAQREPHTPQGAVAVRAATVGAPGGTLRALTAMWEDLQRSRLAATQRGMLPVAEQLHHLELQVGRQVTRELQRHPLGTWLPPGLRGVHVARLLALIDDPWRFPGRQCTEGHYLSARPAEMSSEFQGAPGRACTITTPDGEPCTGTLLPPRPGTGVRSLWHYCGLHVVDGHSPRRARGQVASWNPTARTVVLMPNGIADQVVRHRVGRYRDIYDSTKARLAETRAAPPGADQAEGQVEIDTLHGLRPFQVDGIARKVAAKAFLGDLLTEWKHRTS